MKKLVISEHGELLDELNTGDRILRAKSIEFLKKSELIVDGGFVKLPIEELQLLLPELNIQEKSFLMSVAPYVGYDDCKLKWPKNGYDITSEQLLGIVGGSKSGFYRVINSLTDKRLLYGKYYINPWVLNRGKNQGKELRKYFKDYKIRSMGGIEWRAL